MLKVLFGIFLITKSLISEDTVTDQKVLPVFSTLFQKETLTIHPDFTYTHVEERKIIVTSAEGLDHAFTRLHYDKLNEVKDFQLEVKDVFSGKTIKKAKLKDMGDAAAYSTSTVLDDNRYRYFGVTATKFPIEVLIRSEVFSKSNFFIPRWLPVPNYNQKVEESSYTVQYPTELGFKYKGFNLSGEKIQKTANGITTITWTEKDLKVLSKGVRSDEIQKLLLAPGKFVLDQYPGEMNDWSQLASWKYEINRGRDVLPAEFKEKVKSMVSGVDEPYEKVKILYSFLQNNFRYVSIQLGIGGWQTMTAADVIKYSYGDCKGLTNLMRAMLKEVGISSNYTLVLAGQEEEDIEVDLPSNQFNHVILQVITDNGPIWLECTSNRLPAGFLGVFTRNRHVLVTKDGGGYLTKTPAYDSEEWNLIQSQAEVVLDSKGNAIINAKHQFYGNFSEKILDLKNLLDERQQRDNLNKNSSISGLIVQDFRIDLANQDSLTKSEITYSGVVQKFTQSTAKRLILKSFLGRLGPDHLASGSLKQVDDYSIKLSDEWRAEGEFPHFSLNEENFSGLFTVRLEANTLLVRREISVKLPEGIENKEKTELLKRINTAFDRAILLTNISGISSNTPKL
jgi:hypothetical protein